LDAALIRPLRHSPKGAERLCPKEMMWRKKKEIALSLREPMQFIYYYEYYYTILCMNNL
jgi:hypothetical protein